jgi:F0F1-type ATP synthase membrane subunit b/b'
MFVLFFFILTPLYLKPFQKLIEKRNHKLNAEVVGAADLLKAVESKLADYDAALLKARTEARLGYEKSIQTVRAEEDALISQHRDALKKDFQNLSQQLNEQKQKAEAELKTQVSVLADGVVERLLSGK